MDQHQRVAELVNEWLSLDRDPVTRAEIQKLFDEGKDEELFSVLKGRMTFGTAGLRGPIRAGFLCMNELTITQAAQGLYVYLDKTFPDLKERGIAIGCDARNYSAEFADITAVTFLVHGVKVYRYSRICPTPYVPFATTHFNCCAGVMVTASHNPATDNGYKVYWADGVQITEPHDAGIQKAIEENQKPWPETLNRTEILAMGRIDGLLVDPFQCNIEKLYHGALRAVHFRSDLQNRNTPLTFAYSAMWGVGFEPAMKALATFGFDIHKSFKPVAGEFLPDPTFGGCPKPNPEERFNMERVSAAADKLGCPVTIANDPDADRLTLSEKQPDGTWKIFHGNEIGILMADWLLSNWPARHEELTGEAVPRSTISMINSTVSSKMLRALCEKEDITYHEVLTGFKWIGRMCREEEAKHRFCFFGFEEAIGYMCGTPVRDKDGISAVCCFAEMATDLYLKGSTLWGHYKQLSERYGWYRINNSSIEVRDVSITNHIFNNLRTAGDPSQHDPRFKTYATDFGPFKVAHIRDLTTPGYDDEQPDFKPILPVSGGQMITYKFANGGVMTLRTSGTEPKVKWYIEMSGSEAEEPQKMADALAEELVTRYLRPFQH